MIAAVVLVLLVLLGALAAWCVTLTRALHRVEVGLADEADRVRSLEVELGHAFRTG